MTTKLDKKTLKGIRLDGQIIPSTTDNVQVQARYVQVTPDPTDLNNILGMSNVTGSTSGGCANNLYDVLTGMIPYTGAGKDVNLGSHAIKAGSITAGGRVTAIGVSLSNVLDSSISSITSDSGMYLLTNYGGSYNCLKLENLYKNIAFTISTDSGGNTGPLIGHLTHLYNKVYHIKQPLRFKGVINTGGKLPGPNEGVEVGDVYHFNADVDPYNIGDEVVYVGNTPDVESPWELLGQNITPIPTDDINFKNLES